MIVISGRWVRTRFVDKQDYSRELCPIKHYKLGMWLWRLQMPSEYGV